MFKEPSIMVLMDFCDLPVGEYFMFNGKEYHKIKYGTIVDEKGQFVDFWEPERVHVELSQFNRIYNEGEENG